MTATAAIILLAWLFALCAGVRFVAPFCGLNDSEPRGGGARMDGMHRPDAGASPDDRSFHGDLYG